jgi:hypothetical protein
MAEAATRKCKESWSCETLGDLGGGSRHHTLHGVFGGVKYRKVRSFFIQVALYNQSLHRNGGKRYYHA